MCVGSVVLTSHTGLFASGAEQKLWIMDQDIAGMFSNFQLHADVVPCSLHGGQPQTNVEKGEEVGDMRWAF